MKKLIALLSSAIATSALFASPVLSPNTAAIHRDGVFFCDDCSCWSLRAGFRGDYVWNRHLENIDVYRLFSNSGVLTLNIWDRVDIYGFVGATSQDFASNVSIGGYIYNNVETETIWGVGARATLWETNWGSWGTTYFGIDGNYESVSTGNLNESTFDGFSGTTPATVRYREWQVSLQAGQRIHFLTPYIAIKWSNARANIGDASYSAGRIPFSFGSPDSSRNFGYAVGVALVDAGRVSVQAEARFVDEKAATIQAEFRF